MAAKGGKKTEFRYTVDLTQLTAEDKVVDPSEFVRTAAVLCIKSRLGLSLSLLYSMHRSEVTDARK